MTIATASYDTNLNKFVLHFKGQTIAKGNSLGYLERVVTDGVNARAKKFGITGLQPDASIPSSMAQALTVGLPTVSTLPLVKPVEEKFNINERFGFVEDLANMIIAGQIPSMILTGEGGLGKSYTVLKCLEEANLKNSADFGDVDVDDDDSDSFFVPGDYTVVKGYSTARGLYRTLFENRNKIVVMDDTDSILKDSVAINLLKAALDSYDERRITWNSDRIGDDLPKNFLFTGQIIFISNLSQSKIDQALRSRSMSVDLTMNNSQKIERMRTIISTGAFMPTFAEDHKLAAIDFIEEHIEEAAEVNLRTLISITKIAANSKSNWKKLALYVLTNG